MLFTQVLLPLLPLASAISLHGLTRKAHSHLQGAQHALRGKRDLPVASSSNATLTGLPERRSRLITPKGGKAKRLVRKPKGKRACRPAPVPSASASTIGNDHHAQPTTTASPTPSPSPSPPAPTDNGWQHIETWSGNTFFDHFDFWNWDDPTHGTVDYQNADQSWSQGLVSINAKGHAIMDVDKTQHATGRGRKAVRLHGKRVFTGGLVLMDSWHMPTGCGTWPAWWSNGPNWPYGGEIDIFEGVNEYTQNQVSLHTGSGCRMPDWAPSTQTGTYTTGWYDHLNCASYETGNSGCGVRDQSNPNTYGAPFNQIGGGVYALYWAKDGFKFWFFPRYAIPQDITDNVPNPKAWGTPIGNFPSDNCDPYKYFYDHFNIFTNTFCGDWAGSPNIWNYAGWAGQDKSCAAITGYSTCEDYVRNMGSAFTEAYWEIASIKYFNSTTFV